jgi:hypothetical protein
VQLRPCDAQVIAALEAFVRGERSAPANEPAEPVAEPAAANERAAEVHESSAAAEASPPVEAAKTAASTTEVDEADALLADAEPGGAVDEERELDDEDGAEPAAAAGSPDVQKQKARHERLRKLNQTQQQKIARRGELNDRIMLERLYGRNVWDSLLHNPKLTIPEVASIARKGTLPRPLLELIVENNSWIQAPMVRRALLGNPRVSSEAIMKLLRITPKHELKIIYKTTTYSSQVRDAARKVLDL